MDPPSAPDSLACPDGSSTTADDTYYAYQPNGPRPPPTKQPSRTSGHFPNSANPRTPRPIPNQPSPPQPQHALNNHNPPTEPAKPPNQANHPSKPSRPTHPEPLNTPPKLPPGKATGGSRLSRCITARSGVGISPARGCQNKTPRFSRLRQGFGIIRQSFGISPGFWDKMGRRCPIEVGEIEELSS